MSLMFTLKEELVAGDLPILAVPFTTAMLSLEGLPPNLSRMFEQLRKMSDPSATAPLRLMLVLALMVMTDSDEETTSPHGDRFYVLNKKSPNPLLPNASAKKSEKTWKKKHREKC